MKVERNVSMRTIVLIEIVMVLVTVGLFGWGIYSRVSAVQKSENYEYKRGTVLSSYEYEHEDSDDNTYYTYSAHISFEANGATQRVETEDIFDYEPGVGEYVGIMYNPENVNDFYVSQTDWMTGKEIPLDSDPDALLFGAFILLAFSIVMLGFMVPGDKAPGICIGLGLLLIGVDGVVGGIITGTFAMFILLIFGAVGAFILYQTLFYSKEQIQKMDETGDNLRLFVVRNTSYDSMTGEPVAEFGLIDNNGDSVTKYSMVDTFGKYMIGGRYQIDKRKLKGFTGKREINGEETIDITGIDQSAIEELSPIMEKLFDVISKTGQLDI